MEEDKSWVHNMISLALLIEPPNKLSNDCPAVMIQTSHSGRLFNIPHISSFALYVLYAQCMYISPRAFKCLCICGHKGVSVEARDPYFPSSSIALCLASWLKLPGQCELWDSAFVLLVIDMYTLYIILCQCWGIQTQVLLLWKQAFYNLSHLPKHMFRFFKLCMEVIY